MRRLYLIYAIMRCVFEHEGKCSPSQKDSSVLSQREVNIVACVALGFKNQEIAEKLNLSLHRVNSHLYNVYKKINVPDRLQAVFWAAKNL